MRFPALALLLLLSTAACSHKTPAADFDKIAGEFVYTTLSFSPVTASSQGLPKFNRANFDADLHDISLPAIRKQRDYYIDLHKRLEGFDKDSLTPEDRADYDIINTQIGLALFDTDIAQT